MGIEPNLIKQALYTEGAIAGAIYASNDLVKNYKSGIIRASQCEKLYGRGKSIDHAIVIVGYGGSDFEVPYWIIANSWGDSWGDRGFFRVEMEQSGTGACGI